MEDSFIKLVYLYNSFPSNASNKIMLLSDVASTKYSPLGLNFIIFIQNLFSTRQRAQFHNLIYHTNKSLRFAYLFVMTMPLPQGLSNRISRHIFCLYIQFEFALYIIIRVHWPLELMFQMHIVLPLLVVRNQSSFGFIIRLVMLSVCPLNIFITLFSWIDQYKIKWFFFVATKIALL